MRSKTEIINDPTSFMLCPVCNGVGVHHSPTNHLVQCQTCRSSSKSNKGKVLTQKAREEYVQARIADSQQFQLEHRTFLDKVTAVAEDLPDTSAIKHQLNAILYKFEVHKGTQQLFEAADELLTQVANGSDQDCTGRVVPGLTMVVGTVKQLFYSKKSPRQQMLVHTNHDTLLTGSVAASVSSTIQINDRIAFLATLTPTQRNEGFFRFPEDMRVSEPN
jgi:hypothetical protein